MFKYTVGLFAVYPFAYILNILPTRNAKNLFSLIIGVILVQWIFEADWFHFFFSSLSTYILCYITPKKYCGKVGFWWIMIYMTLCHIYRMYVAYLSGIFDFTGTQMVLTMKLSSFAYNIYDGMYDAKRIFDPNCTDKVLLNRRKFAITKFPNLLDFFGYIFCFTCILAGPAFEYKDYIDSITGEIFYNHKGEYKKPNTLLPGLKQLFIAVICLVGYLQLNPYFKVSDNMDIEYHKKYNIYLRFLFLWIAMFSERLKFYFVWKIAEGSSALAGFGFEGFDKDDKPIGWKGVENMDILGFELAPTVQNCARSWNKRTQGWLERYSYHRYGKSLFITYFISAFWHGLYPGFFMVFLTFPLMTQVDRLIKIKINPYICPEYDGFKNFTYPKTIIGYLYWIICMAGASFSLNYTAMVFSMGSFERSNLAYMSFNYAGHIAMIILFILLSILPTPKKKKLYKNIENKKKD